MSGRVEATLADLDIVLPEPSGPLANYVPTRIGGRLLFVSGQIPIEAGAVAYRGLLGGSVELAAGRAAARLCALNVLAQARAALGGDLDRIAACLRLGVFVAAVPEFDRHAEVANGASDLMVDVLGEAGRHTRAAVGCASLPRGVPVEVDAIFELA